MDKESICHSCGKTMDRNFMYCPWCGTATGEETDLASQLDEVFQRIETNRKEFKSSRISRMETELGELDEALSLLLSEPNPI